MALLGVTALLSFLIVFPLWYAATHARAVFTLSVFILAGLLLVAYVVIRLRKEIRESEVSFKERFLGGVVRVSLIILYLILLFGVVLLFAMKMYFLAIPGLCLYLILLGFFRYGRKKISSS